MSSNGLRNSLPFFSSSKLFFSYENLLSVSTFFMSFVDPLICSFVLVSIRGVWLDLCKIQFELDVIIQEGTKSKKMVFAGGISEDTDEATFYEGLSTFGVFLYFNFLSFSAFLLFQQPSVIYFFRNQEISLRFNYPHQC